MDRPKESEVILIVDDDEYNRYTFERYLRQVHFEVWTAKTGQEGLALARKRPSLIMLDIQLPDVSGYDLCRTLKTDPLTASIPVLHTSATFTESSDLAFGLEGGADGYLIQPIDAPKLTATVKALLRVRAAEAAAKTLAAQWQTTFDSISDGLCLVDASGQILRFNESFTKLFPENHLPHPGLSFDFLLRVLSDSPIPHRQTRSEIMLRKRWYQVTTNSLKDDHGMAVGEAWVFSDVHSMRETELKLQDLNNDLEQRVLERTSSLQSALHQLEQFSYAISHDLRAPLRAMSGYSKALLEDYSASMDEEAQTYLQKIAQNAARLDKMIVDVLTFTKISKESPVLSKLSLAQMVEDVVEHYPGLKPPFAFVDLNVQFEVLGNESGLIQALSNLLGNAVKFVSDGVIPKIRVWSELRGERVRVWVEDNGIGILPEYQHRLFGMFERVLPSKDYQGTGVGLAITRKVIERMGGATGMESDGKNGCKFWIELEKA